MKNIKSLPCPFCGDRLTHKNGMYFHEENDCHCCLCGLQFPDDSPTLDMWNMRKPMERIADRLKEISEVYCNEYRKEEGSLYLQDALDVVQNGGAE